MNLLVSKLPETFSPLSNTIEYNPFLVLFSVILTTLPLVVPSLKGALAVISLPIFSFSETSTTAGVGSATGGRTGIWFSITCGAIFFSTEASNMLAALFSSMLFFSDNAIIASADSSNFNVTSPCSLAVNTMSPNALVIVLGVVPSKINSG